MPLTGRTLDVASGEGPRHENIGKTRRNCATERAVACCMLTIMPKSDLTALCTREFFGFVRNAASFPLIQLIRTHSALAEAHLTLATLRWHEGRYEEDQKPQRL